MGIIPKRKNMKKLLNWIINILKLNKSKKDSTKEVLEEIVNELNSDEPKVKRLTYIKRTDL
jgi:hypothetical protein